MPEVQIFKATYSGVPVYEMMCKGVAVMRRRSDSWLNATQILKVAGFDKPQRTRVLEREIQKGIHEKVQGGYGKYQGTWIPLERGLELAKQYNCEAQLRPIIDFQPASKSPPLAPKHLVAGGSGSMKSIRKGPPVAVSPSPNVSTRAARRQAQDADSLTDPETRGSDGSMTPSPSEASSSSRTPSPINSPGAYRSTDVYDAGSSRRRYRRAADVPEDEDAEMQEGDPRSYGDQILEYFISDTNQIPQLLITPPIDFNPNMAIDDDGHTALHWACAMGRIRVVKLLLTAGADIYNVNKAGQTALMRSVMFANNYDVRKFPELYELLHRSTLNIDNYNRTVFHHVVDVAMSKGKTHAARYYMETILTRLADYPKELADVINFQDEDGETALTMAARCRSKRLVKLLIDHGADPKIVNNDGKSTEDYILEDERFRSSPAPISRGVIPTSFRSAHGYSSAGNPSQGGYSYGSGSGYGSNRPPPLHHSVAAQKASTKCVSDMSSMLDSLAASFDQELREKERDMTQAHALLSNIQAEILDSQRAVGHLRIQAEGLAHVQRLLQDKEAELAAKMGQRFRHGWEKWILDEETREKVIRDAAGGELRLTEATGAVPLEQESDQMSVDEPAEQQPPQQDGMLPVSNGKRKATVPPEDISDLQELYSNLPTDPAAIQQACDQLRDEIASQHRKRRKEVFEGLVKFQANAGTGVRMNDYKRLISAASGIPVNGLDDLLDHVLEALESEEPQSSITWLPAGAGRIIPVL